MISSLFIFQDVIANGQMIVWEIETFDADKETSTLLTVCALFAGVSAKIGITIPDADSVWYTGATGLIEWNSTAAEFGVSCDIQLIDVITEKVALNLTNSSIPCSINKYNTTIKMPKFKHEDFLVRIGVPNNSSTWSYTQDFKILK